MKSRKTLLQMFYVTCNHGLTAINDEEMYMVRSRNEDNQKTELMWLGA